MRLIYYVFQSASDASMPESTELWVHGVRDGVAAVRGLRALPTYFATACTAARRLA